MNRTVCCGDRGDRAMVGHPSAVQQLKSRPLTEQRSCSAFRVVHIRRPWRSAPVTILSRSPRWRQRHIAQETTRRSRLRPTLRHGHRHRRRQTSIVDRRRRRREVRVRSTATPSLRNSCPMLRQGFPLAHRVRLRRHRSRQDPAPASCQPRAAHLRQRMLRKWWPAASPPVRTCCRCRSRSSALPLRRRWPVNELERM